MAHSRLVWRVLPGLAALLACLLQPGGAARADEAPGASKATALVREGNALFQKGDFAGALEHYSRAQTLSGADRLDFNIGRALLALGRSASAATRFERFLERQDSAGFPALQLEAKKALERLQPRLGRLRLECPLERARVLVDGAGVGRTPLAHRIYVEPGEHRLGLLWKGRMVLSRRFSLAAGQERAVRVTLGEAGQTADGEDRGGGAAPARDRVDLLRERRQATVWGYTTLGTGLALCAAGGVLLGVGIHQGDDGYDAYRDATARPGLATEETIAGHLSLVDEARSLVTLGGVLTGVGAAALGLSIFQLLSRPDVPAERGAAGITLSPLRGGAALGYGGSFE